MNFKRLLVLLSIATLLTGCNHHDDSSSSDSSSTDTSQTTDTSSTTSSSDEDDFSEYYSEIGDSLTGTSLLSALNALNTKKKVKNFGYADHKFYQKFTEIDPLGNTPAGKMYGFYDNTLVKNSWDNEETWNREHVWPKSRGGDLVEGDLLMVRPTSVKINSERGNKVYGTGGSAYDPGQYITEYRGIAARIIFYCAIANTNLKLSDSTGSSSDTMGVLSTLLKWNLQYAPGGKNSTSLALRIEWNRNYVMATKSIMQGNRNPFVDHPEYACKIWGNTNSATKSACGM